MSYFENKPPGKGLVGRVDFSTALPGGMLSLSLFPISLSVCIQLLDCGMLASITTTSQRSDDPAFLLKSDYICFFFPSRVKMLPFNSLRMSCPLVFTDPLDL